MTINGPPGADLDTFTDSDSIATSEMNDLPSNAHTRRRHPGRRGYFVAALAVLGAVVVALVAGSGDSEATQRVRLAAQKLDGGRIVRVAGTEPPTAPASRSVTDAVSVKPAAWRHPPVALGRDGRPLEP